MAMLENTIFDQVNADQFIMLSYLKVEMQNSNISERSLGPSFMITLFMSSLRKATFAVLIVELTIEQLRSFLAIEVP